MLNSQDLDEKQITYYIKKKCWKLWKALNIPVRTEGKDRLGSYLDAEKEIKKELMCGNKRKHKTCFLNPRSIQSIYRNKIFI